MTALLVAGLGLVVGGSILTFGSAAVVSTRMSWRDTVAYQATAATGVLAFIVGIILLVAVAGIAAVQGAVWLLTGT